MKNLARLGLTAALFGYVDVTQAAQVLPSPDIRAAEIEAQMTADERNILTHGIMAMPTENTAIPSDAALGAGYIAGIPRLNVPALKETDASLGVAYILGLRKDGATALPSGVAMGATWNPDLVRDASAMIGSEAGKKGFNVMLAGGTNLMREPRNGRTFEYFGEDPLHSGTLAGAAITGIQSTHVMSTVKHFAFNDEETGRRFGNANIDDAAARESDLLAFEIAIENGKPGSVLCAYNNVNGSPACGSTYLLNQVLKKDWGYKGFVMSDWGAVDAVDFALQGLDQQSGAQLDKEVHFGSALKDAAASNADYAARVADINRRVLRSIYAVGLDTNPPVPGPIDFHADGDLAEKVAKEGIVLLRNRNDALPLSGKVKNVALIGGYADSGVLSGGGSSQVQGQGGPALAIPFNGQDAVNAFFSESYQRSVPLDAIKARIPNATISYRNGRYITDAVIATRQADVAIVFATQWMTEGLDVPDLNLPNGQDALISAVASANPNTIVVLETGGPVLMPWLDQVAGVVEAWYPGARGAEAIAAVLFGDTNPSGRLPITFPAALAQLPRPRLPGSDTVEPNFDGTGYPGQTLDINYNIEGSDVGYRWFARKKEKPLFPFGFGLSYSRYLSKDLTLSEDGSISAHFNVTNVGGRKGAEVAQLYLVSAAGAKTRRLAGFAKLMLAPGETREATVKIDPRVLAKWQNGTWHIISGQYGFALGASAEDLGPVTNISLTERQLAP